MLVTRKSMISGTERARDIDVTQDQLDRHERGEGLIQVIMPDVSAADREFIMTGITEEEWEGLKEPEEEEDDRNTEHLNDRQGT